MASKPLPCLLLARFRRPYYGREQVTTARAGAPQNRVTRTDILFARKRRATQMASTLETDSTPTRRHARDVLLHSPVQLASRLARFRSIETNRSYCRNGARYRWCREGECRRYANPSVEAPRSPDCRAPKRLDSNAASFPYPNSSSS